MPLPEDGQTAWGDDLNDYLVGAAVEVEATLDGKIVEAEAAASAAATARTAAETARDEAAALVLSDLGTTDGQTRALIENPVSQTATALSATTAPKALVVADSLRTFGHSYMGGAWAGGTGSISRTLAPTLAELLGLPLFNEGISGSLLSDSLSGWGPVMQKINSDDPDGSGRNGPRFTPSLGLYPLMHGINDLASLGASGLAPFESALRLVLSRLRAGACFNADHDSVGLSGAWNTLALTDRNAGPLIRYSASNGETITITTPTDFPGGTIGLVFTSWVDGGAVITSESIGGQTYSVDTNAVHQATTFTGSVLRVPLPAGSDTYTFTVSGVVGAVGAIFSGWHWECPPTEGPLVPLILQPKPLDYDDYLPAVVTDAGVDALNAILTDAADELGDRVLLIDTSEMDDDPDYWLAGDIHPTMAGHRRLAEIVAEAIRPLVRYQPTPSPIAPRVDYGYAPPAEVIGIVRRVGDRRINLDPVTTPVPGWVCVEEGQPGVWAPEATLDTGVPIRVTWTGTLPPDPGFGAVGDLAVDESPASGQPTVAQKTATGWEMWRLLNTKGSGGATLVGGEVAVTGQSQATASTMVEVIAIDANGGTPGALFISNRVGGTGFTIKSTSATDTSIVAWYVLKW